MIILFNNTSKVLSVQYIANNEKYVKELRPNVFVGMKQLQNLGQLTNRVALAREGVMIYHFESNSYFNSGYIGQVNFGAVAPVWPFQFIAHNTKREAYVNFIPATMAAGATRLQGLVA